MEITVAENSHVPGIVKVWKELMDFHRDIDTHWSRSEDGHINWEKFLREMMKSEDARVLVALDKGHVVGYSISEISKYPPIFQRETRGVISDMAVISDYRSKGVGGEMLSRIRQWFDSRNIDRIELGVAARNQVGYSFWKKHGFQDYMHRLYLEKD
jgi:ribosomal protein S18 acetylase RimI-like enzyme